MANKSVYQEFDTNALNYFDLASAPIYGVVAGSGIEDVLCTQDQTTYEKINSILTVPTESGTTFITKKKAFILPKCGVSQDRLKAALKEHGITVTNDYTLADLIIGHEGVSRNFQNGQNIMTSIMMSKLWNYEVTQGSKITENVMNSLITNYYAGDKNAVIVTEKITEDIRYHDLYINDSIYDSWILTGLAINLAHIIETTDVSVIDPQTVLHSSANKIELDYELLEDLTRQINAYNSEDTALAGKIIPTIDYTKHYHLLWKFAQDNGSLVYNYNRDKDIQYCLSESNFISFTQMCAQDMILWLEKNDKLCKTTFRYLEPIVRQEISIHNRDLYTFKVAVKKEYQQYLSINEK